ncbi:MAG: hypothetical protein KR126chlam1_00359 [Chlamydiae bacterium]|nr:hypothetical protein [Chlamydiota bacterium]
MITPISFDQKPPFGLQELSPSSPPLSPSSSALSSLREGSNEGFFLTRWVTRLFTLIKSLFSCLCTTSKANTTSSLTKKQSIKIAAQLHIPEVSPLTLPNSPFRKKVFLFPTEGKWEFRGKEFYRDYTKMFLILGNDGPWTWYGKQETLFDLEDKLDDPDASLHPLEILYFLFHNRAKTQQVAYFKSQVDTTAMNTIIWFLGRENAWTEFLEKQEIRFKRKENTITSMLPGFCAALNLQEKTLLPYIKDKKWQALTTFVYEARKEHFNL